MGQEGRDEWDSGNARPDSPVIAIRAMVRWSPYMELSARQCSESFAKINSFILHDNTAREMLRDYPSVTDEELRGPQSYLKGVWDFDSVVQHCRPPA